jgi:hypothetical protein
MSSTHYIHYQVPQKFIIFIVLNDNSEFVEVKYLMFYCCCCDVSYTEFSRLQNGMLWFLPELMISRTLKVHRTSWSSG